MQDSPRQQEFAELLAAARRDGRQLTALPAALLPATPEEAYAVNALVAARLGWEPLGWKIAGTTVAVREKLGLPGPIYGRTFRRHRAASPARLQASLLLDPLVECEFFVTLARALPPRPTPWTMAEVQDSIGSVHAGIEVAECRLTGAAIAHRHAILADGSASGWYVFGDPIPGWREGLAPVPVVLEVDGVARHQGSGAEVMGDPLAPLLWLAEERRRWGDGLAAGEMVSTGSMTGMLRIQAGQRVRARFGAEATVEIAFDA